MAWKLEDVSRRPGALPLSGANEYVRRLVNALKGENNNFVIDQKMPSFYFNHTDNRDPGYNGGTCPSGVSVLVYYAPANNREYNSRDTVDSAGYWSGRRRICVRKHIKSTHPVPDIVYSFWQTSHPLQNPGLRTGGYTTYVAINCTA
jgi:hypothetical protein